MNWRTMSRFKASELSEYWNSCSNEEFNDITERWNSGIETDLTKEYRELRTDLRKIDADSQEISSGISKYAADLKFGILLYGLLKDKYGFNASLASDDDIWRYIHMSVVPDLILNRWPDADENHRINDSRFWKDPRRIWLKTIWWYIHLSLQNNSLTETERILRSNNSDDIYQLVERAGTGYRVELYRAIMKRYADASRSDSKLLRKVLKLNIVRCATVEPLFVSENIEDYVNELFDYFGA